MRDRRSAAAPLPPNRAPWVIAHRGASSEVAEHTLPAYQAAIDVGADGLECDVRLTRDGHLVCVHDRTVNRTSDGVGPVSELDLTRLQALDFRSWKWEQTRDQADAQRDWPTSPDELVSPIPYGEQAESPYTAGVEPDRLSAGGSQVLTLETLLATVADAGRPLKLLIETKHPTRYGGLVEKELVRMLRRFGWAGHPTGGRSDPTAATVTVMSFAPVALRRVRLLAPAIPLVLLMDRWPPVRRDGSLPTGVSVGGPGVELLRTDLDYVERAHAHGNRVFCWTVDHPRDVSLVSRLGVDAIITNRPAAVREQLESVRP